MINKINIHNFKCFADVSEECKNFNLLVGTNSSGKSSFIQALLLFNNHSNGLNGDFVSIGTFREAKSSFLSDDFIKISIEGDENCSLTINENSFGKDKKLQMNMEYLSCNRIGVRDIQEKNLMKYTKFGIYGEYAIDYLVNHFSDKIDSNLCEKDPNDLTLLGQVNLWLSYIVGAKIKCEDVLGTDVVKASYEVNNSKIDRRAKNIGSGVSYLVSLIIMCLASQKGDIIIIENPEIHLHPKAQSRCAELLFMISQNERQVFVESHSDHIFNKIRLLLSKNSELHDLISIKFFNYNNEVGSKITNINIKKFGIISNAPEDLFDQFDIDNNAMIGLK